MGRGVAIAKVRYNKLSYLARLNSQESFNEVAAIEGIASEEIASKETASEIRDIKAVASQAQDGKLYKAIIIAIIRGRDKLDNTYNYIPFIIIALIAVGIKAIYLYLI